VLEGKRDKSLTKLFEICFFTSFGVKKKSKP